MITTVPGVFIDEGAAKLPLVVSVSTSVAAFVGYTERADDAGTLLRNTPKRISSMSEFELHFGGTPTAHHARFSFIETAAANPNGMALAGSRYLVTQTHGIYLLHSAMQLYFQNGGGPCYVVSAGGFEPIGAPGTPGVQINAAALTAGLQALQAEGPLAQDAAIVLIPEAVVLPKADCEALQNALLIHCGVTRKNRFAILDVRNGHQARNSGTTDCIQEFRSAVGNGLEGRSRSYAAAYYPWLNTSIVSAGALGFRHFGTDSLPTLVAVMRRELMSLNVTKLRRSRLLLALDRITATPISDLKAQAALVKRWTAVSPAFNAVTSEMARQLNLLPPSAAMAGVYAANDAARGVWKAPANVALSAVTSPAVTVTNLDQEDLNIDIEQGKSVNAIRAFPGKGVLVWGARTLDGNSDEWRYINVRRTVMMVKESARQSLLRLSFEPNNQATWATVKWMLENFLNSLWRQGALAGAKPEHAFVVAVGLGTTMTSADVQAGLLRVNLMLALTRPAEFMVIQLTQQMPVSLEPDN
jgi:uncharacterized protein